MKSSQNKHLLKKKIKILLIQIEPGIAPRIFDMNMFECIKFIEKKIQNILNPNIAWYFLEWICLNANKEKNNRLKDII